MKKIINVNKTIREQSTKILIETLINSLSENYPQLQKDLLSDVLIKGKTFAETSKLNKLTSHRQKIILKNSVNQLSQLLKMMGKFVRDHDKMEKELEELKQWKKILESNIKKEKDVDPELNKLLSILIYKTELSGRVKGICKYGYITTIRDLVKLTPLDFLALGSSGKKSMAEVESFFQTHGLSWNMDV